MAAPHRRVDAYGKPLAELADAQEQVLFHAPANQEKRRQLVGILDRLCQEYLRRGHNVEISLRFIVSDGVIQDQIYDTVLRRYGGGQGWRQSGEDR